MLRGQQVGVVVHPHTSFLAQFPQAVPWILLANTIPPKPCQGSLQPPTKDIVQNHFTTPTMHIFLIYFCGGGYCCLRAFLSLWTFLSFGLVVFTRKRRVEAMW